MKSKEQQILQPLHQPPLQTPIQQRRVSFDSAFLTEEEEEDDAVHQCKQATNHNTNNHYYCHSFNSNNNNNNNNNNIHDTPLPESYQRQLHKNLSEHFPSFQHQPTSPSPQPQQQQQFHHSHQQQPGWSPVRRSSSCPQQLLHPTTTTQTLTPIQQLQPLTQFHSQQLPIQQQQQLKRRQSLNPQVMMKRRGSALADKPPLYNAHNNSPSYHHQHSQSLYNPSPSSEFISPSLQQLQLQQQVYHHDTNTASPLSATSSSPRRSSSSLLTKKILSEWLFDPSKPRPTSSSKTTVASSSASSTRSSTPTVVTPVPTLTLTPTTAIATTLTPESPIVPSSQGIKKSPRAQATTATTTASIPKVHSLADLPGGEFYVKATTNSQASQQQQQQQQPPQQQSVVHRRPSYPTAVPSTQTPVCSPRRRQSVIQQPVHNYGEYEELLQQQQQQQQTSQPVMLPTQVLTQPPTYLIQQQPQQQAYEPQQQSQPVMMVMMDDIDERAPPLQQEPQELLSEEEMIPSYDENNTIVTAVPFHDHQLPLQESLPTATTMAHDVSPGQQTSTVAETPYTTTTPSLYHSQQQPQPQQPIMIPKLRLTNNNTDSDNQQQLSMPHYDFYHSAGRVPPPPPPQMIPKRRQSVAAIPSSRQYLKQQQQQQQQQQTVVDRCRPQSARKSSSPNTYYNYVRLYTPDPFQVPPPQPQVQQQQPQPPLQPREANVVVVPAVSPAAVGQTLSPRVVMRRNSAIALPNHHHHRSQQQQQQQQQPQPNLLRKLSMSSASMRGSTGGSISVGDGYGIRHHPHPPKQYIASTSGLVDVGNGISFPKSTPIHQSHKFEMLTANSGEHRDDDISGSGGDGNGSGSGIDIQDVVHVSSDDDDDDEGAGNEQLEVVGKSAKKKRKHKKKMDSFSSLWINDPVYSSCSSSSSSGSTNHDSMRINGGRTNSVPSIQLVVTNSDGIGRHHPLRQRRPSI